MLKKNRYSAVSFVCTCRRTVNVILKWFHEAKRLNTLSIGKRKNKTGEGESTICTVLDNAILGTLWSLIWASTFFSRSDNLVTIFGDYLIFGVNKSNHELLTTNVSLHSKHFLLELLARPFLCSHNCQCHIARQSRSYLSLKFTTYPVLEITH